jgi:diphosphomevalonate decarboxylase
MKKKDFYTSGWKCPSNIALIKYWGKKGDQLPQNPSLSFVLEQCHTHTQVDAIRIEQDFGPEAEVIFNGSANPQVSERILAYLNRLAIHLRWLRNFRLVVDTRNSFPHGAGIASSASGFGALALCLADIGAQHAGYKVPGIGFFETASRLARLGSGSAARSVYPGFSLWGRYAGYEGSSDAYAVAVKDINPVFYTLCDSIVVISDREKAVSSGDGHWTMRRNPYAKPRYNLARENLGLMLEALEEGNLGLFGWVAEREGMGLHGLMMLASEPYLLLESGSIEWMRKVTHFRQETQIPLTFTFDAGPNLHIIYPAEHKTAVRGFIDSELKENRNGYFCIHDNLGAGPEKT